MRASGNVLWLVGIALAASGCGSDKSDHADDGAGDGSVDASVRLDGSRLDGGMDGSQRDATADGAPGTLPDGSPFVVNEQGQVLCGTAPCACSNGLDEDNDGKIDLADLECVSSWDNDEATFATGIPGDNRDTACQDCFFDGNSGSGNDGCRIATSCLQDAMDSSSGRGSCDTCTANDKCRTSCQAYTPNGCDCFGCCTVQLGSGIQKSVLLSAGCSIDGTTTTGCTECVPSTTCKNTCGECELCPGKTAADLPASCNTGGGTDAGTATPSCDDGQQVCTTDDSCPVNQLCEFGCCQLTPILI
jgi:hypothetical protein